jgi:DNA replication and repair protein RecF
MLVKGGPSIRRRFLDTEISQTSPFYCHNLVNYNRVLLQRNNLLRAIRERREKAEMLEAWDLQLAEYGTLIIQKRAEFIEKLGAIACSIHREITGGREELKLVYLPSVKITTDSAGPSLKEYFFQELRKNRETEINRGITIQGPHRDEIEIKIGETNLKAFGSQGQQRTSAVSIKLSEMELMKKETGEYPVLLLDDVMSELDAGRRKFLLSAVSREAQLFVTTTNLEEISSPIKRKGRIYEVKNGQLFILQEG